MRLDAFTITRYRSINRAQRVPVGSFTVLVGPNNEGKSNILRALGAAFAALRGRGRQGIGQDVAPAFMEARTTVGSEASR